MIRKIVSMFSWGEQIYAFCDDETLWYYQVHGRLWINQRLPPIPQPEEYKTEPQSSKEQTLDEIAGIVFGIGERQPYSPSNLINQIRNLVQYRKAWVDLSHDIEEAKSRLKGMPAIAYMDGIERRMAELIKS